MRVYFDSSAFAKRYVEEPGSAKVLEWCERADELMLSVITLPEIVSAFRRLVREGRLTEAQYRGLKAVLLADIADASICDVNGEVLRRAMEALERQPLRAMDAIHIAAALAAGADVFVSSDARQCEVAGVFEVRVERV